MPFPKQFNYTPVTFKSMFYNAIHPAYPYFNKFQKNINQATNQTRRFFERPQFPLEAAATTVGLINLAIMSVDEEARKMVLLEAVIAINLIFFSNFPFKFVNKATHVWTPGRDDMALNRDLLLRRIVPAYVGSLSLLICLYLCTCKSHDERRELGVSAPATP